MNFSFLLPHHTPSTFSTQHQAHSFNISYKLVVKVFYSLQADSKEAIVSHHSLSTLIHKQHTCKRPSKRHQWDQTTQESKKRDEIKKLCELTNEHTNQYKLANKQKHLDIHTNKLTNHHKRTNEHKDEGILHFLLPVIVLRVLDLNNIPHLQVSTND